MKIPVNIKGTIPEIYMPIKEKIMNEKEVVKDKRKLVSWSQFKQWRSCPYQWKLNYVDKLSTFTDNIYTMFGKSIHTVIQTYVKTLYMDTIKAADALDLNKMLETEMRSNFLKVKKKTGEQLCTLDEMVEFYSDGVQILDELKKRRAMYFTKKGYELVGIELKLNLGLPKNINFVGYIDLIIKDTIHNRIKIYDLKTSTKSWNKWKKADKNTTDQLLLYKTYYSIQYEFPLDRIDVEFFILKRQLYEGLEYPQKRIQLFSPANGKISLKKVNDGVAQFVTECFTEDGEYNLENNFKKLASPNNCRFCEFRTDKSLCDKGI